MSQIFICFVLGQNSLLYVVKLSYASHSDFSFFNCTICLFDAH